MPNPMKNAFLKWANGKTELVPRILQNLPNGQRLIEPFTGSCAVALNAPFDHCLLADSNQDLIHLFKWLKESGPPLIADCQALFEVSNNKNPADDNKGDFYYDCRQRFNETPSGDYWRAVLFVYLNRYGYSGLCHYDQQGCFDVPYGMYRKPHFPGTEMAEFHQWAQRADFHQADFRTLMDWAEPGDVIYCDPPNLPLTTIDGLVVPMEEGFSMQEQIDLVDKAATLAKRGIPVLISNLDTSDARELYAGAKIDAFPVRRYIRDKGGARGKVWEIVAVFS